jgi:ATP-dependent DNA ligase
VARRAWARVPAPGERGEAIVTNERGLAVFDLIRHKRHGDDAVLVAFDLIELDGEDLRPYANRAP